MHLCPICNHRHEETPEQAAAIHAERYVFVGKHNVVVDVHEFAPGRVRGYVYAVDASYLTEEGIRVGELEDWDSEGIAMCEIVTDAKMVDGYDYHNIGECIAADERLLAYAR